MVLELLLPSLSACGEERRKELKIDHDEIKHFNDIVDNMYYPVDEELAYLFSMILSWIRSLIMFQLYQKERPLNQNWSWDRILRSCYIKQADVLQGMYTLGHLYDVETKNAILISTSL